MNPIPRSTQLRAAPLALLATVLLGVPARADLGPEWLSQLPLGSSLSSGYADLVVDGAGVAYLTGTTQAGGDTDVLTAAFGPDGTLLWSHRYDGPRAGSEQARGLALGPSGELVVCGSTPDALGYANVLVLTYDAGTGALVNAIDYTSGAFTSESGISVVVDGNGDVFVGGNTVGDGGDAMLVKFDAAGAFQWRKRYDGSAFGPFSQDYLVQVELAADGDVLALIHAATGSGAPDYVVIKYGAGTGSVVWQSGWGTSVSEAPVEMELDAAGDVYVTGTALNVTSRFGTIKLRGSDGLRLWQVYDANGFSDYATGLAVDDAGGVYVTGQSDPDGNGSNFNDDYFTVKRDAATGAFLWSHAYGDACVGCFDTPSDVAADSAGNVYVAGGSSSAPYTSDVLTFVLDAATGVELDRGSIAGLPEQFAGTGRLAFDAAENLYDGSSAWNTTTGRVELTLSRWTTRVTDVHQLQTSDLFGGAGTTLSVRHANPGAVQFLAVSGTGTASVFLPVLGTTLDLANPLLLGTGIADGAGTLDVPVAVPASLVGATLWLQALELGDSTPTVRRTVL